jgi:predicted TIM-barrel fold metal-dependent hydrolase
MRRSQETPLSSLRDFYVVSGDTHIIEPADLFKTRLPAHLRDRALWEEEFTLDEPIVEGGHTEFKKLHTIGFDGWTVSKYRQFGGPTPDGDPENIIRDMDVEGIDASVMFPNLSLFVLFTDDHELSMAHARVWNDFLAERYVPYTDRMRPVAAIPMTDVDDAVAEIERVAGMGLKCLMLPENSPKPYYAREYDRIWAAAVAHNMTILVHCATGGVMVKDNTSTTGQTVKQMMTAVNMGKGNLTDDMVAGRTMGAGSTSSIAPVRIIGELIGGGVCERFPDLHFVMTEFNAHWLVSFVGVMDRAWRTGIGQDADWWLGFWDEERAANDQPAMGRLFNINGQWPYPLKPSEYLRRQIHVQLADDRVAVQARHITGMSTLVWGNDYPHAEGTFRGSEDCVADNFEGVPDDEKAVILGHTLAGLVDLDSSRKVARVPNATV